MQYFLAKDYNLKERLKYKLFTLSKVFKSLRFPWFLMELPCAILLVLLIRCIRPFCIVRFFRLDSYRLGHFAGNTELYLCERDMGINVPKFAFIDFCYCNGDIPCNAQLDRMWRRILHFGPRPLLELTTGINALIPGSKIHVIHPTSQDRDVHNLLDRVPPHLSFTAEEEKRSEAALCSMGIPLGAPFICLTVRDESYLKAWLPEESTDYHNYRDCSVQNYCYAALELAKRGYYVIRMGAIVKETMNITHPMIIDYAKNGMRTDFMDIYLAAKCEFCISNGTGFDAVPRLFRRPIVFIDHVPLEGIHLSGSQFLFTFKKHWAKNVSRFLTVREIFRSRASGFGRSEEYMGAGIDLIESTPEEIAETVLEMGQRLKGTWKTTEEDEELHRQFFNVFERRDSRAEVRSRVGTYFLRKNVALLE